MAHSRQRGQNLQRRGGVEQPCPHTQCEHRVRAVVRLSVEPQTHHGSGRALKSEADVVALNPGTGILTRRGHKEIHRHRGDRHREKGHGETDRDWSCAVTNRIDGNHQKARKRSGTVPPQSSGGNQPCRHRLHFRLSLQSCERINSCCFTSPLSILC